MCKPCSRFFFHDMLENGHLLAFAEFAFLMETV